MTKHRAFLLGLSVSVWAAVALAQQSQPTSQEDRNEAARIASMSERIQFAGNEPDAKQRRAQMVEVTDRIRAEIDNYIRGALKPDDGSQRIQDRLRSILTAHRPAPEFGDLAFARLAELRTGQSLIVAYTIVRGPHDDLATIRGYRSTPEGFELAATAGDEFESYNMFKTAIPSPVEGEFWLMAWGQEHTFNGKKVRFRIYAFDGQSFRTMWNPDDMFDADDPSLNSSGFMIHHRVRYPPWDLHDEYLITPNGPIRR
jgi:hypothetical protein